MAAIIPTRRIQFLEEPISENEATMNNTFNAEYRHVTLFSSNSVETQISIPTLHCQDEQLALQEKSMQRNGKRTKLLANLKRNLFGKFRC